MARSQSSKTKKRPASPETEHGVIVRGGMEDGRLFGYTRPRLYTKPLRELTPETSLGFEAIRFAEGVLQVRLLPWQKWVLIHMLELKPGSKSQLRFRTILLMIARQNGKSLLDQVICLWRMYMGYSRLVLGTAQSLDTAEEVWESAVDLAETIPELAEMIERVSRVNGKKFLGLTTGQRWKVAAATRKGGRGLSADTVVMDELREHTTWEAWGAITNTAIARASAVILCTSNAGDKHSVVLKDLRQQALAEVEDGTQLGIFEYSAEDECDLDDRDAWAHANPSLGYIITEDAIEAARRQPESVFRTENLCQWVESLLDTYIDQMLWASLEDRGSQISPESEICFGLDCSASREYSYISVAGYRDDGRVHVEPIAARAGVLWTVPLLEQVGRAWGIKRVGVQARGCMAAELIPHIKDAGLEVVEIGGSALGAATGQFYDLVRDRNLRHRGEPLVDGAVATAMVKKLGEAQVWDRTGSPGDIAPLVSMSWAAYALANPAPPPQVSAYAQMDNWWEPHGQARQEIPGAKQSAVEDLTVTKQESEPQGSEDWWR